MRKANIAPRAVNSWTALMPRRHERRSGTAATPHERRCSADHERREGADQEKRVGNNHLESATMRAQVKVIKKCSEYFTPILDGIWKNSIPY